MGKIHISNGFTHRIHISKVNSKVTEGPFKNDVTGVGGEGGNQN